jgi:hypothetical protein
MDLESELDRLYQVPAAAFVNERNALAKTLRQSGDKAAADEVARLGRPSPVAWAVNQLHYRASDALGALKEAGAALRQAQEESFDSDDFAARRRAHQAALRAATAHAMELAEEGGLKPNAAFQRRLESTLNLLGAAVEDVTPPPGRMSAELETMGFDALTAAAPAPPPKSRPKREAPPADPVHAEKLSAFKAALDAVAKEVRKLELEAEASEARHTRAARDADDAAARATAANIARDEARKDADRAREHLDHARAELDRARRAFDELSESSLSKSASQ